MNCDPIICRALEEAHQIELAAARRERGIREDLTDEEAVRALRIGRIEFKSAGAARQK